MSDLESPSTVKTPLGFLRDAAGDWSLGRLIALVGMMLGTSQVIEGNVLTVYETFFQAAPRTSNGLALAAIGAGLFTSGALLKGWQAQSENRGS